MDSATAAAMEATTKQATPVFDADGFMLDPACWTHDLARAIAGSRGIALVVPEHWTILACLRNYHSRFSAVPPMRRVYRPHRLPRGILNRLFGAYIEAWRIAGLPNPGEEARAHMSNRAAASVP